MRAAVDPVRQPVRLGASYVGILCCGGDGYGKGLARAFDLLGERFLALESRFAQGADIYCSCWSQSGGSEIKNISTSPVPERPQFVVKRARVKSGLTLACGSAQ